MSKRTWLGLTRAQTCYARMILAVSSAKAPEISYKDRKEDAIRIGGTVCGLGGSRRSRRLNRERLAREVAKFDGRAVRRWHRGTGPKPDSPLIRVGNGRRS